LKGSYASAAVKSYRVWVERFQAFAGKLPEQITVADYTLFAEQIKRTYAPKSVEFALNIVHNYLRFFAEQGRLKMPMYLLRVPKAVAQSHCSIEEADYQKMLGYLRNEGRDAARMRDTAILMLLHDTGMRIGELLSLRVGDVEAGDCSAVVVSEKSKVLRRVFWSDETEILIRQQLGERVKNLATNQDMLFVPAARYGARAINSRSVQRRIKQVAKKAGIASNIVPHSFRHAYIHRLAKVGTPDAIIAQMVGHSTPLTISHYTKLSRPEMLGVARRQFTGITT
jgi:integrase/recombinase XerD